MPRIPRIHVFLLTTVTGALLLSGCAVGPDFKRPAAPDVDSYTNTPLPKETASADIPLGMAQDFQSDQDIPADWWKLFSSPTLDSLIEEAIKHNPDLEAAQAALRQANYTVYAGEGYFFPAVDVAGGIDRKKISKEYFGDRQPSGTLFTLYNASVNVSYVLDVFGGLRRGVESLQAQADYQRYQMEATYLTLTANIITALVQEASLREQIVETKNIIGIEHQQLGLLRKQLEQHILTKAPVLAQETILAQAEATLPQLRKQLEQKHEQVTVLMGGFPNRERQTVLSLAAFHLPKDLPVSLPSKLVEQRPDIRAAEETLHKASADIGVATADMLPSIALTARYGTEATRFHDMFSPQAELWDLGAGVLQPIFHGGELWYQRKAAVEAYKKASAQYRSTVLLAFENVSDVLHALQFDASSLQQQVHAAQVAGNSLDISEKQFQAGSISYLTLLDAERTCLQSRLALIQARADRIADTAALFQALGGGWWNRSENL